MLSRTSNFWHHQSYVLIAQRESINMNFADMSSCRKISVQQPVLAGKVQWWCQRSNLRSIGMDTRNYPVSDNNGSIESKVKSSVWTTSSQQPNIHMPALYKQIHTTSGVNGALHFRRLSAICF